MILGSSDINHGLDIRHILTLRYFFPSVVEQHWFSVYSPNKIAERLHDRL